METQKTSVKEPSTPQTEPNASDTEHPCSSCDAHCCRHVAVRIDTPTCKRDYDSIRWYLLHQDVWVSIDHEDDWLLEFRTPCKNIRADLRCSDYDNRPRICRDYPAVDQYCERETDEAPYRHLFTSAAELERHLDKNGVDWRWKRE